MFSCRIQNGSHGSFFEAAVAALYAVMRPGRRHIRLEVSIRLAKSFDISLIANHIVSSGRIVCFVRVEDPSLPLYWLLVRRAAAGLRPPLPVATTQVEEMKISALVIVVVLSSSQATRAELCAPTERDSLGPFFVDNAPVVTSLNRYGKTGEPMRLSGQVRSAEPPNPPIPGARLEVWQTDGNGSYHPAGNGDAARYADAELDLRGTVFTDGNGKFKVMTLVPGVYRPRPRHIHYKLSAPGFRTLVTQHYLSDGETVPGGPCRSGVIDRFSGTALFEAPTFFLSPG